MKPVVAVLSLGLAVATSVAVSSQEGMPDHKIVWPPKSCLHVIEAIRWAKDCQDTAVYRDLFWEGSENILPDGARRDPREAQLNGPCPTYRTYLREVKAGPSQGNSQSVKLKEITTKVDSNGEYSGDYGVSKMTYVCEKRHQEWRVSSRTIHSHNWFVNEESAHRFKRSGGWDGDPETPK